VPLTGMAPSRAAGSGLGEVRGDQVQVKAVLGCLGLSHAPERQIRGEADSVVLAASDRHIKLAAPEPAGQDR
jgi:hypothetical protein